MGACACVGRAVALHWPWLSIAVHSMSRLAASSTAMQLDPYTGSGPAEMHGYGIDVADVGKSIYVTCITKLKKSAYSGTKETNSL